MKFEFTMLVPVTITSEDIDDIMVAALEGGITNWCRGVEVVGEPLGEYASDQISRGGALLLFDSESSDTWILTRDKFIRGFKLWLESDTCECGIHLNGKVDTSDIDAECADAIIQYALFGELVFG